MRINFESKSVYGDDDKYITTKIKAYAGSTATNFHNKRMSKEKSPWKYWSIIIIIIIILDYIIKANKKHYPQKFLEERKYVQEMIKTEYYIDDGLKSDRDSNKETDCDNDE